MSNTKVPYGFGPESKPFDEVMHHQPWSHLPDFADDFDDRPPGLEDYSPVRDRAAQERVQK